MDNPLAFIHGSGDTGRIWRLQVEHFGTNCAFPIDLPGHGQRPDNLPPEVSVLDYTRAAHQIIFQELHNAGHFVMREQPEQVNQAIDEWLSRQ